MNVPCVQSVDYRMKFYLFEFCLSFIKKHDTFIYFLFIIYSTQVQNWITISCLVYYHHHHQQQNHIVPCNHICGHAILQRKNLNSLILFVYMRLRITSAHSFIHSFSHPFFHSFARSFAALHFPFHIRCVNNLRN